MSEFGTEFNPESEAAAGFVPPPETPTASSTDPSLRKEYLRTVLAERRQSMRTKEREGGDEEALSLKKREYFNVRDTAAYEFADLEIEERSQAAEDEIQAQIEKLKEVALTPDLKERVLRWARNIHEAHKSLGKYNLGRVFEWGHEKITGKKVESTLLKHVSLRNATGIALIGGGSMLASSATAGAAIGTAMFGTGRLLSGLGAGFGSYDIMGQIGAGLDARKLNKKHEAIAKSLKSTADSLPLSMQDTAALDEYLTDIEMQSMISGRSLKDQKGYQKVKAEVINRLATREEPVEGAIEDSNEYADKLIDTLDERLAKIDTDYQVGRKKSARNKKLMAAAAIGIAGVFGSGYAAQGIHKAAGFAGEHFVPNFVKDILASKLYIDWDHGAEAAANPPGRIPEFVRRVGIAPEDGAGTEPASAVTAAPEVPVEYPAGMQMTGLNTDQLGKFVEERLKMYPTVFGFTGDVDDQPAVDAWIKTTMSKQIGSIDVRNVDTGDTMKIWDRASGKQVWVMDQEGDARLFMGDDGKLHLETKGVKLQIHEIESPSKTPPIPKVPTTPLHEPSRVPLMAAPEHPSTPGLKAAELRFSNLKGLDDKDLRFLALREDADPNLRMAAVEKYNATGKILVVPHEQAESFARFLESMKHQNPDLHVETHIEGMSGKGIEHLVKEIDPDAEVTHTVFGHEGDTSKFEISASPASDAAALAHQVPEKMAAVSGEPPQADLSQTAPLDEPSKVAALPEMQHGVMGKIIGYWMDEVPAGEWRVAVRGGQVFDQAKLIRDHLQENWASKLQGHDAYRKALDMVAQISQHEQALAGGEPDAEAKRRLLTSLMGWKKELAKISIGDILKPKIT